MDMKLFQAIIISISILLATTNVKASSTMPSPTWLEDDRKSFVKYNFRYTQYMGLRLTKDEKNLHKSAVFYMLQNAGNG